MRVASFEFTRQPATRNKNKLRTSKNIKSCPSNPARYLLTISNLN
jgi:hypothetical protein